MKRGLYGLSYHELVELYYMVQRAWSRAGFRSREEILLNMLINSIGRVFIFLQENSTEDI